MITRIITYVNIFAVSMISYQAVDYVYTGFEHKVEKQRIERSLKVKKEVKTDSFERKEFNKSAYKAIGKRNIFNVSKEENKVEQKFDFSNIKKSNRNLKLWGTITGLGSGNIAIIEDTSSRKQELYRVDDVVKGAKIINIVRNKVVISVNGSEEILEISDRIKGAFLPVKRNTARRGNVRKRVIRIKRSQVERALEDVGSLSKQISFRPYYKNGEPAGIRIRRISRLSFFRRIGLRSGDVIKSVQGNKIRTIRDAMNIQNALLGASEVAMSIERLGRPLNIEYNIYNR